MSRRFFLVRRWLLLRVFRLALVSLATVPALAQNPTPPAEAVTKRAAAQELSKQGKYKDAVAPATEALALTEQTFGPQHLETARALELLGVAKRETAAFPEALRLLDRAREIYAAQTGAESGDTLRARDAVAAVHYRAKQFAQAETIWRDVLAVRERVSGVDSYEAGIAAGRLALARHGVEDYPECERLLRRAIAAEEKKSGPDSADTSRALENLATIYADQGNYQQAAAIVRRTLETALRAYGPDHPSTATSQHNLARNLMHLGQLEEAGTLYQQAIATWEKTYGPEDPRVGRAVANFATSKISGGDYSAALPLLERAGQIQEKALGAGNIMRLFNLTETAGVRLRLAGENPQTLAEAEKSFRDIIAGHERLGTAEQQNAVSAIEALAYVLQREGRREEALAVSQRAAGVRERQIGLALTLPSEARRLEYLSLRDHLALAACLGDAEQIAQIALRIKGTVLDSLLADKLSPSPDNPSKEQPAKSSPPPRRELTVTPREVRAALPKGSALVEFVRYHKDPLCSFLGNMRREEFCYGAAILAADGTPAWVPLGAEEELEPLLKMMQRSLRDPRGDALELEAALRKMSRAVWQPLAAALPPGTEEIVFSPEGMLNFASFGILLTGEPGPSERFVAEKFRVRYVASGRDLLAPPAATPDAKASATLVAFSNPAFSGGMPTTGSELAQAGTPAPLASLRAIEPAELRGALNLSSLPGTEAEVRAVLDYARRQGWEGRAFQGGEATEKNLFALHGPRVLHLATHGFFLPYLNDWRSPMQRSGLALSGAADTLSAWEKGRTPPPEDDGVVTAEEVTRLDLHGTWLVALSACDTGLGEPRAGEGVFGLRRGFVLAGARHLLMTLWPVNDKETSALMLDFYAAAEKSGDPALALAEVQRARLARLRAQRGLAAAARLAGPFILSSQAR